MYGNGWSGNNTLKSWQIHQMAFLYFDLCWQLIWEWSIKSEKHYWIQLTVLIHCQHRWLIVILLSTWIKRIHWSFQKYQCCDPLFSKKVAISSFPCQLGKKKYQKDRIRSFSLPVDNEKSWSPLYLRVDEHWSTYEPFKKILHLKKIKQNIKILCLGCVCCACIIPQFIDNMIAEISC